MKNSIKGLVVTSLLAVSTMASAEWNFSGGYANFQEEDSEIDISLGAVYASAAYEYESGNMVFMPELRIGTGIKDDTIFGVDVEIDSIIAASVRGQYNVNDSFGIFLQPSYARLEITASAGGFSESEDDWEFGFGGGAIFKLSDNAAIEGLYESFDGTDVLSVGVRFTF